MARGRAAAGRARLNLQQCSLLTAASAGIGAGPACGRMQPKAVAHPQLVLSFARRAIAGLVQLPEAERKALIDVSRAAGLC